VLPIEDVEQIFGFVNSVVRIECVCRKPKYRTEQRYCYGITMLPQWDEMQKFLNETDTGMHDPLNNLWSTISWYLFFILTLIFSVRIYRET